MPLEPIEAQAPYDCGTGLMNAGRLDEALLALQKAVDLKPGDAQAQCNLGHCLVRMGRFAEGRAALQRGHELGIKQPSWPYPSRSWVRNADMLIKVDGRLDAILAGKTQPADTGERLALALLCQQHRKLYAASARFFADAFRDDPKLAEDQKAQHRYNAACAAALAAAGQGKDGGKLDDRERSRWRKQVQDWLTADLALWAKRAAKAKVSARAAIRKQLLHWQSDSDLAGVRDEAALARLPAEEQAGWRKLWADVASTLGKVRDR
jgi:tetratricopeptide (TPR) repeat protein